MPNPQHESEQPAVVLRVYPPAMQGRGAFDGGRITERKPVGMPHDGARQKRIGPLFYWAWATAKGYGKIGLHPHQGFEIMSYVIEGEMGHYDTLGTRSRVGAGGAQVMQTGSGVAHEEETIGAHNEFFQIWFEPYLREAMQRPPTYTEIQPEAFPAEQHNGVTRKVLLGEGAPVSLVADVQMLDVTVQPGSRYEHRLAAGRSFAALTIYGQGRWDTPASDPSAGVAAQDLAVVHARTAATLHAEATGDEPLRFAIIEVPTEVDYPLYPMR